MSAQRLTIGGVARSAGVNIETVRYYQRRGLVTLPAKRARGFRYYAPETADRIRFIKRAQALGLSLDDVQRLLRLDSKGACQETRSLALAKLELIERKISELAKLRDALQILVAACDRPHGTRCPIIERLESEES
jgi:MerR family mercuric resistance operon transcriptional regulator